MIESKSKIKNFNEMYAEWKKNNSNGLWDDKKYKSLIPMTIKNIEGIILEEEEKQNAYLITEIKFSQIINSLDHKMLYKENLIGIKNYIITKGTQKKK